MPTNPYSPPRSEVADVVRGETAPPLWNPNAAASWSLLFSPVFGAVLHMKNWQALGETEKAQASKKWVWGSIAVFVLLGIVSIFVASEKGMNAISRAVAIGLLVSWYLTGARHQTAYVAARFGTTYARRGWAKPLLLALLAVVGFIIGMGLIGFLLGALLGAA